MSQLLYRASSTAVIPAIVASKRHHPMFVREEVWSDCGKQGHDSMFVCGEVQILRVGSEMDLSQWCPVLHYKGSFASISVTNLVGVDAGSRIVFNFCSMRCMILGRIRILGPLTSCGIPLLVRSLVCFVGLLIDAADVRLNCRPVCL